MKAKNRQTANAGHSAISNRVRVHALDLSGKLKRVAGVHGREQFHPISNPSYWTPLKLHCGHGTPGRELTRRLGHERTVKIPQPGRNCVAAARTDARLHQADSINKSVGAKFVGRAHAVAAAAAAR